MVIAKSWSAMGARLAVLGMSLTLALLLPAACTVKDAGMAARECSAITAKALPGAGDDPDRFAQQTRYATACMASRGLHPAADTQCGGLAVEGTSIDSTCFR
jgi:hypothetical protein